MRRQKDSWDVGTVECTSPKDRVPMFPAVDIAKILF
jgi:hypothetical protein